MKKKGFTLIELLAVIVILAIIALIATPMIMGVIEKARKEAAISSAYGYVEAIENHIVESLIDTQSLKDGVYEVSELENLEYKGKGPSQGYVRIQNMEVASAGLCMNNHSVYYNGIEVKESEKEYCGEEYEGPAKIYGVRRNIDSETTEWERIEDSVKLKAQAQIGEEATNVTNDFDTIYPWSGIKSYNYNTETKKITAWIDEEGFQFNGSNGEVLTYIPEFYYKREQKDGYEYVYISEEQIDKDYEKSEAFSIGRYTMSGTDEEVHSKSGVEPLTNKTIENFRTYARKLGSEFSQLDYHYFIIQLLYLVEYADYDSQKVLGQGNVSNTEPITSGGCDDLGMKSGTFNNDGYHSMIYRGMEDIYGNVWQYIDGINIKEHKAYVCYNPNQYKSDTFDGCYKPIGYINAFSDACDWITKLGYDKNNPLIGLPTATDGGSENTYIPDRYWKMIEEKKQTIVLIGGRWDGKFNVGLWSCTADSVSSRCVNHSDGARLIKTS